MAEKLKGKTATPVVVGASRASLDPDSDGDFDYDADSDIRTLQQAHHITTDGKRMARMKKHHRRMAKAMKHTGRLLGGK